MRGPDADPGAGPGAKPIERKRAELAACRPSSPLSAEEVDAIRAIGDNRGSMLLKGATPDHEGEERPTAGRSRPGHAELAERWGIEPERDLRRTPAVERRALGLQQLRAALQLPRCPRGRALSRQSA